jgi:hypothetical protein
MNCCNKDCNQGRDCPVRVAKVGQRHHDAEPLPPSTWRRHLRDLAGAMLLTFVVMILSATLAVIVVGW